MYILLYAAPRGPFPKIGLVRENLHTVTTPLLTPQSLRPDQDGNIAESSFIELTSSMEYRIRIAENIELLTDGNKTMVGLDGC